MDTKYPEIPAAIRDDKEINEETEEQLKKAIDRVQGSSFKVDGR